MPTDFGRLWRGLGILVSLSGASLSCGGVGAQPEAVLGDTPSKGPVGKTIRSGSEKFVLCARDSVTIQTGSTQELKLRFIVEPDGNVHKARVQQMSVPDPDLQTCVVKALKKLHFPPPTDHQPKEIVYPLVLKPE